MQKERAFYSPGIFFVYACLPVPKAYFQGTPPEAAPMLRVPKHSVIKLSPSNYGWTVDIIKGSQLLPKGTVPDSSPEGSERQTPVDSPHCAENPDVAPAPAPATVSEIQTTDTEDANDDEESESSGELPLPRP